MRQNIDPTRLLQKYGATCRRGYPPAARNHPQFAPQNRTDPPQPHYISPCPGRIPIRFQQRIRSPQDHLECGSRPEFDFEITHAARPRKPHSVSGPQAQRAAGCASSCHPKRTSNALELERFAAPRSSAQYPPQSRPAAPSSPHRDSITPHTYSAQNHRSPARLSLTNRRYQDRKTPAASCGSRAGVIRLRDHP